eukprot:scaffold1162_cov372-Prasinococcus_capsulatus_cf.AAC.3
MRTHHRELRQLSPFAGARPRGSPVQPPVSGAARFWQLIHVHYVQYQPHLRLDVPGEGLAARYSSWSRDCDISTDNSAWAIPLAVAYVRECLSLAPSFTADPTLQRRGDAELRTSTSVRKEAWPVTRLAVPGAQSASQC